MLVRRFVASALASSLVAAGLTVAAGSSAAATPPPRGAVATEAYERPDMVSAAQLARSSGRRVLVTGLTTQSSLTFANPDGTQTSEFTPGPVRVQVGGAWRDVDPTLVSDDAGLHPKVALAEVSLPTGGASTSTKVSDGTRSVALRWPSSLPMPVVAGDTATYPDVVPGGDLVVRAAVRGFELSVVLRERPSGAVNLRLPMVLAGLSADTQASGAVVLRDAGGAVAGLVNTPRMWAAGREHSSRAVAASVARTATGPELRLVPDAAFLADPLTAYPVTIDPTVTLGALSDTMVDSANASTNYGGSGQLHAGRQSPTSVQRSYVKFGMGSSLAGKHVTAATVKVWNYSAQACADANSAVYKVTSSWNASTMTWSSGQPSVDGATGATNGAAHGYTGIGSTCSAQDWLAFSSSSVTSLVQGWVDGTVANHGLQLAGPEGTACVVCWKGFRSNDYVTESTHPVLEVTANSYPASVWGRSHSPSASYTASGGAVTSYVTSRTPTLRGVSADADAGTTRINYEIWNAAGTVPVVSGSSPFVQAGTHGEWTVPALSQLADGTSYKWRAKGDDGTDVSKSYNTWLPFTVDVTAPPAATVSSSSYPAGAWSGAHGQAGSFTFAPNGAADLGGYYYWLDGGEPEFVAATGTTSVSLTPDEGLRTLSVQSADKAGNRGAVTTHAFSVGEVGVTSPAVGRRIEQTVSLTADARGTQWTSLTWKWRRAAVDSWSTIATVTRSDVTQPFAAHPWVASGAVATDGPFELVAVLSDGTATATSQARAVALDRADFGTVTATEQVGPASVNLQTGNTQLSTTDVSVDAYGSDLTVSRTFNSRAPQAGADGPFGPGWTASVPVESAGSDYVSLADGGSLVTVTLADGDTVGFTKKDANGNYAAEHGAEDLTLTNASSSFQLEDIDGNVTTFTQPSIWSAWVPTSVTQVGDTTATTYMYETVAVGSASVTRVAAVMAPSPPGVTCALPNPSVRGCRGLALVYAAGGTTPPGAGQTGDYPHRLRKVRFTGWDPAAGAMSTVDVAEYAYDAYGRLAQAWDPRLASLKTAYTYNAAGQVATLTPPAEEAWTFGYADLTGETNAGRLRSVSRPTLTTPSIATTTVVYGVPVSGTGAPHDLSSATLARTGQTDAPVVATAVFPATTTASLGSDPNMLPASYDRATVHYLNVDGREVNTADAGGGISTAEHDSRGAVVRTLSAGNRLRAFDRSGSDTAAQEAVIAGTLSSLTVFSADGLETLETFGPEHEVMLADGSVVRARAHTANTYDDGAPSGGPFHLVTTSASGARLPGETADRDVRTTTTAYGTTTASWQLGQPTATTIDPAGLALTTRTSYADDGRVLIQTLPAGGTSTTTAATRVTRYYTAGAHPDDTACSNRPEWVNLVCSVGAGGQPTTGPALPVAYTGYDLFNRPLVMTEKAGGSTLRTTTTTYDTAGRAWKLSVTASAGTALPAVETHYDVSGRATETRSLDGMGAVTAQVTRVFNTLGQLTSYTDTDGTTATTTYDVLGRPLVTSDGKGTQTRSYDGGSEKRGLLTSLADSQAGTWAAAYDVEGTATVDWPNGLRATTVVDEAGSAASLAYAATSGCSGSACVVLSESVRESVHGQWLARSSTLSTQDYAYDAAGRLAEVADTVGGQCVTRRYAFDLGVAGNSNRTSLSTFGPGADGACQTATHAAGSPASSPFDAADRITTAGTVYDALGRTTAVPDADARGSGVVAAAYHVNDLVRSVGIAGGATQTYTLDVDQQRVRSWTDGTTTRTHHYDGDGDNPSWTAEGGSAWTRNIGGIVGDLAAVFDSATSSVTLQLTNLHGDVVATAPTGSTALAATMESTEYGAPRGAPGARYAWLGGKQRAADTPAGLSIMGVRLYNPATGRFLQVDPVYGGNDNAYTYPSDPVNAFDLDGRVVCRSCGGGGGGSLSFFQAPRVMTSPSLRFTKHGFGQFFGRDGGRGVSDVALRATLRNPRQIIKQEGGKLKFIGDDAVAIVNREGRIVTTWATNSRGIRTVWQGCGRCT